MCEGQTSSMKRMSPERENHRIGFEDLVRKAKETILLDGHHIPMVIITGSKDHLLTHLLFMPETHDERLSFFRQIGQIAAKSGRIGKLRDIFFISEGWMSVGGDNKPLKVLPSEDPNRKEVLIVAGLEKETEKKTLAIFEVLRDANEKVLQLDEIEPSARQEKSAQVPLLEAFAEGFKLAFQARTN